MSLEAALAELKRLATPPAPPRKKHTSFEARQKAHRKYQRQARKRQRAR